jgi:alcohol dehydrogenase (NADP+)
LLQAYSPLGSPGTGWVKVKMLEHPILKQVAEKLGKTPAQVALRWGLQSGNSVLPKSTNEDRIKANFEVFDWSIPKELFDQFSQIEQVCSLISICESFSFPRSFMFPVFWWYVA